MRPMLLYILMACVIAIFIVDNPKLSWTRMTRQQIIRNIVTCAVLWPIFVLGVVYGFINGRRK